MGGWTTYDNAGAALGRSFSDTPVGTILGYGGAAAPSGWLLCDGSAVSRTTYADLWSVIGTTYGSGDGSTTFTLPDSSGFIIYAQSISSRVATASPPAYVTSLPSNPVDGQTVVYAADATNGVMWTLRYRAASSSSYKWEFVGGSDLSSEVTTEQSTTSTSYTDLTTSGPSVALPIAGDYYVTIAATMVNTTVQGRPVMSYAIGGTAASDNDQLITESTSTNGHYMYGARMRLKTGLTAVTLTSKYKSQSASTSYFRTRLMSVVPVRVG